MPSVVPETHSKPQTNPGLPASLRLLLPQRTAMVLSQSHSSPGCGRKEEASPRGAAVGVASSPPRGKDIAEAPFLSKRETR